MTKYYDGTKLLSLKDINKNKPEIYICVSNRSAGKTTYFQRLLINRFLKNGEKFGLIYRFKNELENVEEKFFKDIRGLFFPHYSMIGKSISGGVIKELYLVNDNEDKKKAISCGYAFALNTADAIKKNSHLLSDVKRMLFDEFQSENNVYCTNEINKFISIHYSIARGNGEFSRYVPVYMLSNPVSIINPYYTALGISQRITTETRFLKGDGYVFEQCYSEEAANSQRNSRFNSAFKNNAYNNYSLENVYLNDSNAFIEKPHGKSNYLATLKYNDGYYAIREYEDLGVVYCDDKVDQSFKFKLAITTEDHSINYIMLSRNSFFIGNMRYYFEKGLFRFKNNLCKEALLKLISY